MSLAWGYFCWKTLIAVLGDIANGISNLAKEGEVFLDYLAGNLEDGSINNDYLWQEVDNDIIANAQNSASTAGEQRGIIYSGDEVKFVAGDKIIGSGGAPTVDNSSGQGDDRIASFPFDSLITSCIFKGPSLFNNISNKSNLGWVTGILLSINIWRPLALIFFIFFFIYE